jgi:hypothetical protein
MLQRNFIEQRDCVLIQHEQTFPANGIGKLQEPEVQSFHLDIRKRPCDYRAYRQEYPSGIELLTKSNSSVTLA